MLEQESPHFRGSRARAVTSNFLGTFHEGTVAGLVDALTQQLSGSVRWTDNMNALVTDEETPLYEIGPNKPLTRFFQDAGYKAQGIVTVKSAEKLFPEVA
jgi:[acyl-carrier-protein] S-malonyltransferase/trans-AT polyketide synthase/acyltransferase/oxidoreductase domain-containing protein